MLVMRNSVPYSSDKDNSTLSLASAGFGAFYFSVFPKVNVLYFYMGLEKKEKVGYSGFT